MWNLGEPELLRLEPVCGTLGNLHLCKSRTFMWNLRKPDPLCKLLRVEPLCGTLGNLGFEEWNLDVLMWNLVEPQLLTVEPLCGTLWNLNF